MLKVIIKSNLSIFFLYLSFCYYQPSFCQVFDAPAARIKSHQTNFYFSCEQGIYSDSINKGFNHKKLPHLIKKAMRNMVFVDGGSSVVNRVEWLTPTDRDTTLLFYNHDKLIKTNSFLMGKYEVTNKEYREFIYWVRDSIARSILAIRYKRFYEDTVNKILNWKIPIDWHDSTLCHEMYLDDSHRFYRRREFNSKKAIYQYSVGGDTIQLSVYPDTSRWTEEYRYSFNEPFTCMYFWHPAYDDYPVVGVNYNQALAYCHWRTEQLQKIIMNSKENITIPFEYRLPTEIEWDYASIGPYNSFIKKETIFPWNDESIINNEGEYYANSGIIMNENGFVDKYFQDDGFIHTSIVGHYPKNIFGLYDMAGNVSEWTEDAPHQISVMDYFECYPYLDPSGYNMDFKAISDTDDFHSLLKKIMEVKVADTLHELDIDTTYSTLNEKIRYDAKDMIHDYKVLKNTRNPRIVKGGSWADPSIYMLVCMNQVYCMDSSSCKIGFRVAMSVPESLLPYLYKDNYYKNQLKELKKDRKRIIHDIRVNHNSHYIIRKENRKTKWLFRKKFLSLKAHKEN
jgi:formylglycine-generating enzyme